MRPGARHQNRAVPEGRRHVRDVRAPLGVGRTAIIAHALTVAVGRVSPDREVFPTELLAAPGDDARDAAKVVGARGLDAQLSLDALEVRRQGGGRELVGREILAPAIENPRRRAEARAGVHGGRSADQPAHEDGEDRVADAEDPPLAAVELGVRLGAPAPELVATMELAFLDHHDGQAAGGQLLGYDRPAGSRAHDDHVALERLGGAEVLRAAQLAHPASRLRGAAASPDAAHGLVDGLVVEVRQLQERR